MPSITVLAARQAWVLDQAEIWTANGHNVMVADMDERYRKNVVRWLERQVGFLCWNYFEYRTRQIVAWDPGEMARDCLEDELDREFDFALNNLHGWLHSKPLLRALKGGEDAEAHDEAA